jgi:hypothetical protein
METMANPFQLITERLTDLGIFSFFLPWIITAAIMWGLLKRSKIFDPAINAILSIAVSFFVWGYLANTALEISEPLTAFITQGFILMLVFVFGLVGSSMFYPKFSETLTEVFKSSSMIWIFLGLFVGVLFFTSGLYTVLFAGYPTTGVQADVNAMIVMLAALIIGILILVGVQRGVGKKE